MLDEADRMLDMGFWPAMKKIIGATPARQTLLFSATIDASIKNSVGKLLHDRLSSRSPTRARRPTP